MRKIDGFVMILKKHGNVRKRSNDCITYWLRIYIEEGGTALLKCFEIAVFTSTLKGQVGECRNT